MHGAPDAHGAAGASGSPPSPEGQPRDEVASGTLYAVAAYAMWGVFPLYFHLLFPAGPFEILAHRIVWTLVFCVGVLAVRRDLGFLRDLVRRPRLLAGIAVAAVLICINWLVYVATVAAGNVQEAALGYFLNPLVTVALGVVLLGERLRRLQWVAVGIGVVAGAYLTWAYGRVPYAALALAVSFALYGLAKNRLGSSLGALQGLVAETAVLTPVAVVTLVLVATHGGLAFGRHGVGHTALLVTSGVVTAIPLALFALAAARVPLVTIGLVQFVTPIMQLLCGVLILGEHLPVQRWVGFGLVWCALTVMTTDSVRQFRRTRRAARDARGAHDALPVCDPVANPTPPE